MSKPETPPWHPYCGCSGCRLGDYIGRKAVGDARKRKADAIRIETADRLDAIIAHVEDSLGQLAVSGPILIPCEGAGCSPVYGICSMCGQPIQTYEDTGNVMPHLRDDLLARIDRGDFHPEADQ